MRLKIEPRIDIGMTLYTPKPDVPTKLASNNCLKLAD